MSRRRPGWPVDPAARRGHAAAAGAYGDARAWRDGAPAQRRLAAAVGRDRPAGRQRRGRATFRSAGRDGCDRQARERRAHAVRDRASTAGSPARSRSTTSCAGSAQFASVGYWLDRGYAGRGVMPTAVALVDRPLLPRRRAAPHRGRDPAGELQLAAGGGEARHPRGRLRAAASCTSTATGATTGSSRSPPRSAPTGCCAGSTLGTPPVTRVISATHLWTSAAAPCASEPRLGPWT